jgi:hypothetical protein
MGDGIEGSGRKKEGEGMEGMEGMRGRKEGKAL